MSKSRRHLRAIPSAKKMAAPAPVHTPINMPAQMQLIERIGHFMLTARAYGHRLALLSEDVSRPHLASMRSDLAAMLEHVEALDTIVRNGGVITSRTKILQALEQAAVPPDSKPAA
jgi:hypothetical protein